MLVAQMVSLYTFIIAVFHEWVKVQLLVTCIFLNAMGEDADNHVIVIFRMNKNDSWQ